MKCINSTKPASKEVMVVGVKLGTCFTRAGQVCMRVNQCHSEYVNARGLATPVSIVNLATASVWDIPGTDLVVPADATVTYCEV